MVSSYTLTFAGFLLLGGRVGDLFGRKRAFMAGLGLFAVASLAAGLAQEGWQVVAARFVQGIGGAVLVPTTLSLVTTGFTEPRAKAKALSLLTAAAAAGGALGGVDRRDCSPGCSAGAGCSSSTCRWERCCCSPRSWALPGRPPGTRPRAAGPAGVGHGDRRHRGPRRRR